MVVNKVESEKRELEAERLLFFGDGRAGARLSAHGVGVDDLLEAMLPLICRNFLKKKGRRAHPGSHGRQAECRQIINYQCHSRRRAGDRFGNPGTTRDAIDTPFTYNGQRMILIDTAGIRRKTKVKESFDYYSVLRALGAIERSDVAVLVLDATQGATDQDKRISGYAHEEGRAQVIVANKWDLVSTGEGTRRWKSSQAGFSAPCARRISLRRIRPVLYGVGEEQRRTRRDTRSCFLSGKSTYIQSADRRVESLDLRCSGAPSGVL